MVFNRGWIRTGVPKNFSKVKHSHAISETLKELEFKLFEFNKLGYTNFSKSLPLFQKLESLVYSLSTFIGHIGEAMRKAELPN